MPRKRAKRSDGRYELKKKMPDGSMRHFYGSSLTEAQAKYEAARNEMILQAEKEKVGPSFEEVADAYEDYITGPGSPVKRGTISAYRKHLPPLKEYFSDKRMAEIDAQAVSSYLEKMKVEGKSLHTLTNARSVLSCVFRYWCAHYHGTAFKTDASVAEIREAAAPDPVDNG